MDGLTLIRAAHATGMTVRTNGDTLVVKGPKCHGDLVRLLLSNKPVLMAALTNAASEGVSLCWSDAAARCFAEQCAAAARSGAVTAPGSDAWFGAVCVAVRSSACLPQSICPPGTHDLIDMIIRGAVPAVRLDVVDTFDAPVGPACHLQDRTSLISIAQPRTTNRNGALLAPLPESTECNHEHESL